ncbi:MAG: CocE/NonD family hydrolase [Bdellovibrionota bacterium]
MEATRELVELGHLRLEVEHRFSDVDFSPLLILSQPHPEYAGSMDNKVIELVFRKACEKPWSVIRYNMRGVGRSEGTFDQGKGESEDLEALIDWAKTRIHVQKSSLRLLGYSFGSWVSARVNARRSDVDELFLIAPPVSLYAFPTLPNPDHVYVVAAERDELIPISAIEHFCIQQNISHVEKVSGANHFFVGKTMGMMKQLEKFLFMH